MSTKMAKRERKSLSLKDKYEIINKIKSGLKRQQLLVDYEIKSNSHLTQLLKSKEKMIENYESVIN